MMKIGKPHSMLDAVDWATRMASGLKKTFGNPKVLFYGTLPTWSNWGIIGR